MAQKQNILVDLVSKAEVSKLVGFGYDQFVNQATLLAKTYPLFTADGQPSFHMAMDSATSKVWYFNGGLVNSDTTSPANGTNWFSADSDKEIVLGVTNPPINSYNGATLVTAVAPTNLTANTKFVTWTDGSGKVHLYSVTDPMGTPVFKEITTNAHVTIDIATDISAVSPLRNNTIYTNESTGQIWLVDEEGTTTNVTGKNKSGQIDFNKVSLVAGVESVFDINADATIAFQDGEVAVAGTTEEALSKYGLTGGVSIFDDSNNQQENDNFALRPIDTTTFGITSNADIDIYVSVACLLKKG